MKHGVNDRSEKTRHRSIDYLKNAALVDERRDAEEHPALRLLAQACPTKATNKVFLLLFVHKKKNFLQLVFTGAAKPFNAPSGSRVNAAVMISRASGAAAAAPALPCSTTTAQA